MNETLYAPRAPSAKNTAAAPATPAMVGTTERQFIGPVHDDARRTRYGFRTAPGNRTAPPCGRRENVRLRPRPRPTTRSSQDLLDERSGAFVPGTLEDVGGTPALHGQPVVDEHDLV